MLIQFDKKEFNLITNICFLVIHFVMINNVVFTWKIFKLLTVTPNLLELTHIQFNYRPAAKNMIQFF